MRVSKSSWSHLLGLLVMAAHVLGPGGDAADSPHQAARALGRDRRRQQDSKDLLFLAKSLSGATSQKVPSHQTHVDMTSNVPHSGADTKRPLVARNRPSLVKFLAGRVAGLESIDHASVRERPDWKTPPTFRAHSQSGFKLGMGRVPGKRKFGYFPPGADSAASAPVDHLLDPAETPFNTPARWMYPEVMGAFKPRGYDSGIRQSSFFSPAKGVDRKASKLGGKGRGGVATGVESAKHGQNVDVSEATENYRSDTSTIPRGCNSSVTEGRLSENVAEGILRKCQSQGRTKRNADHSKNPDIDDNVTSADISPEKVDARASNVAGNPSGASLPHDQNMESSTEVTKVDAVSAFSAGEHSSVWTSTGRASRAATADERPHIDGLTDVTSRSQSPVEATLQQSYYTSTTDQVDGMSSATETSTSLVPQASSAALITDVVVAEGSRTTVTQTDASLPTAAAATVDTDGGRGAHSTSAASDAGTAIADGTTDPIKSPSFGQPAAPAGIGDQVQTTVHASAETDAGINGVQQLGEVSTADTSQRLSAAAVVDSLDLTSSVAEETAGVIHDVTVGVTHVAHDVKSLDLHTTTDWTEPDQTEVTGLLTTVSALGQSKEELHISPASNHSGEVRGKDTDDVTSSYELTAKPFGAVSQSSPLSPTTAPDEGEGERSSQAFSDGTATSVYDQSSSTTNHSSLATIFTTVASTSASTSEGFYILPGGLQPSGSSTVQSSSDPAYQSTSGLRTSSRGGEIPGGKQTDETDVAVEVPTERDRGNPREESAKGGDETDDDGEQSELASEPDIDWEAAKADWGYMWYGHVFILGSMFGVLGLYVLVCILSLGRMRNLFSRPYFASLNLLMLVMCATRAAYLLADGYNSNGTFYAALDHFLYSISFPCLTSAFGLQLFGLLEAANLQLLPACIQKIGALLAVVVLHFALTISTVAVVSAVSDTTIMLFACQLFFVLWGLFLFLGFAFVFRKLLAHAQKRQKNMGKQVPSYKSGAEVNLPKFTLCVAVKVTLGTAVVGVLTVGLEVYGIVFVYNIFSRGRREHWPWWIYHTLLRCAELLMAACLCYVASLPFRRGDKRGCCCCCPVLCAPCAEICCCGADAGPGGAGDGGGGRSDCCQLKAPADHRNGAATERDRGWTEHPSSPTPKTRICFSDEDHVVPFVTSPHACGTGEFDAPLVGYPAASEVDDSKDGRYYSGCRLLPAGDDSGSGLTSEPLRRHVPYSDGHARSGAGVLNTGYHDTAEDDDPLSSPLSKSRKSSLASSEFFHPPSSLSLAGSIASELDKAFRSLREESMLADLELEGGQAGEREWGAVALPADPFRGRYDDAERTGLAYPDSTVERFLLEQQAEEGPTGSPPLRRSRSAMGRSSFAEEDDREPPQQDSRKVAPQDAGPWSQRLFRAGSGNLGGGGVRTKEVDSARYMSLLDIERNQGPVAPPASPDDDDEDERGRCEAVQRDSAGLAARDDLATVRDDVLGGEAVPAWREGRGAGGGAGSVGVAACLPPPVFGNREVTRSLLTPIDYDSDDIEV